MSISRKLVEKLVSEELNRNFKEYEDLDLHKLEELANQAFLIQVTQNDPKSVKKSLQAKIEHFNSVMSDM